MNKINIYDEIIYLVIAVIMVLIIILISTYLKIDMALLAIIMSVFNFLDIHKIKESRSK